MATPVVHIVGGFLGSGKTTAIAAAARRYIDAGKTVGVVTNDQGKYLVDTLFFRLENVPAVEVTGGCFCCNFDQFEERLAALNEARRPDVIFAESVGSCADVVATVIEPLIAIGQSGLKAASLSVFTDARLLHQRLQGLPMPFSEDIVYIFDKQLEEAGQVVINKADLLAPEMLAKTLTAALAEYPRAVVRTQNSLDPGSIEDWVTSLDSGGPWAPRPLVEIDYGRYGAGETELAWLDREVSIEPTRRNGSEALAAILEGIDSGVRARGWGIGHLKFIIRCAGHQSKVSFTTLPADSWQDQLPPVIGPFDLLINARVAAGARDLAQCVDGVLRAAGERYGLSCRELRSDSFHPGLPVPAHRVKAAAAD